MTRGEAGVLLLLLAGVGVLILGFWAGGWTGDARVGWAGVLLAAGCLFLANEAEAGR